MHSLTRLSGRVGNNLVGAGLALETLCNLLTAHRSKYNLEERDIDGLNQAVLTISAYVMSAGYDLCEAAEAEQEASHV
ncbi:hypothetical protein SAMN05216189_104718 [Pseudomonas delhiensis]|uniref:Uncharacterized protein n=1 Tax=Pseudomonas delhiensis TaxID=366289 RepID=A0A239NCF5_9PSED|nr:hypothetical protein [Pseudomonas delhiensis]SDK68133.1 hypothetical protein SAMN05216189_104718 [Pseudomonas delhiensis]SNT52647.1 hypothetical protein SAMN06295949_14218 [Pseudomonas delhiensis]